MDYGNLMLRVNALFPLNPYLGHVEAMNHHALHLYGQDYFLRLFRSAPFRLSEPYVPAMAGSMSTRSLPVLSSNSNRTS
ncbi:hypothetical protein H112_00949 [Trichophyton rubrum D6]|uniref:Uncharacterized protein n=2 Tax=Trichophyton TaxID=5550 RepID=A0A022WEF3_TRIRU|nr:hypothetical protein H100_00948 [Trichophyton rubrum MR850]EZF46043.1 hypothetical protein H102_00939 [Trichophyton rubrum CBS 100081]EZF56689.1 hypothetical protein H103_00947 [Trichophyton rubrum CBS 288.86]EZF67300.1 hypothetical protein H104_00931 [Trichophyton rubrum CBS 289.86]EZF77960.1 hypothetical protein H105_00946 [Trichophyton soudanense CBS 452.61]EZF88600.1 hypothetical protein H110_00948 [Trichophyton rubrum MR1448]EZF99342.1 hypothetical protein H113_00950 [Trichophyton rub